MTRLHRQSAIRVTRLLRAAYPDAQCALHFENPLQLLIATILSAQCTDERVNKVTASLFQKYRTAADFAAAPQAVLERELRSTGFFRHKAQNIRACCHLLAENHAGAVPADLDRLVALPGVGRKTANVVLGTAFRLATGVVVDTHVRRISRRLGLTRENDPGKIELDLIDALPRQEWVDFSHRVIHHGRQVCRARRPLCDDCPLDAICPRIGVG